MTEAGSTEYAMGYTEEFLQLPDTALDDWASDPAAYFAMAWGEAVGRVPA